ncbi:MAG: hypothetical protein A2745_02940 [Candidatus Harrisonbacteria bacterium RIFCSPHIGHO2_01_FULL_44_13]|uniref:UPF0102 protein A3A16_03965 n=1 Tax=Candidatus Harrisonbacteria bacterium RIFCSPLOWO2_01_FULL_44_18 TaxID=1798407 RepID=A0A1G1ZMG0_9BACT|nr:MAG: hypothetical protein A2745_02940 [Candidatus Harrisonbacteria bacterium RIFCSPHIGHO2_01_FULL_44_13]OGY65741.1 MAG: hypothetical protein A3A16_03965 [Candidatus Harrisonbacteria bacterium RIFCSPLOWO2_01_FULL_44_18]
MIHKSDIGKLGEDLACEYLKNKGYKIIERNFRRKWGELDIIAKDPKNVLVFIEVKTLRFGNSAIAELFNAANQLLPEENLTAAKLKKLKRTASLYAGNHQELINDKKGWRIDLVAIKLFSEENYQINHIENIEY